MIIILKAFIAFFLWQSTGNLPDLPGQPPQSTESLICRIWTGVAKGGLDTGLLAELRCEKEVWGIWDAPPERNTGTLLRHTGMELSLVWNVRNFKKGICKYIGRKERQSSVGQWTVTKDTENYFFHRAPGKSYSRTDLWKTCKTNLDWTRPWVTWSNTEFYCISNMVNQMTCKCSLPPLYSFSFTP